MSEVAITILYTVGLLMRTAGVVLALMLVAQMIGASEPRYPLPSLFNWSVVMFTGSLAAKTICQVIAGVAKKRRERGW